MPPAVLACVPAADWDRSKLYSKVIFWRPCRYPKRLPSVTTRGSITYWWPMQTENWEILLQYSEQGTINQQRPCMYLCIYACMHLPWPASLSVQALSVRLAADLALYGCIYYHACMGLLAAHKAPIFLEPNPSVRARYVRLRSIWCGTRWIDPSIEPNLGD